MYEASDVRVKTRDELDYHSLFGLEYVSGDGLLVLRSEGCIDVRLSVDALRCQLVDTGETTWEQFGYVTFGIGRRGRRVERLDRAD